MSVKATRATGRTVCPQRTCIGCRRTADQSQLLRLMRWSDGEVVVDHPHRLGGRGAYVCSSLSCLSRALRSKRLGAILGGSVTSPVLPTITGQIQERITGRIEGLLAAAGRSRKVALGAAKVEDVLRGRSSCRLVVLAHDASPRVQRSLEEMAKRANVTVMEFGDKEQLGLPFARSTVAAVALTDEGLAHAVRHELALLQGLSTSGTDRNLLREDKALERAT